MSAKEWPPQNTGLFAPPMCVVCCAPSVDKFELREYDANDGSDPVGQLVIDGETITTEAQAIAAVEATGPVVTWNYVADSFYFSPWNIFRIMMPDGVDFYNSTFDYHYTDAWENSGNVMGVWCYSHMRFRRSKGGYNPGARYNCTMEVYRRQMLGSYGDSGEAWALFATITATLTADPTGTIVWEADVPHARGFETWIKARTFSATPA